MDLCLIATAMFAHACCSVGLVNDKGVQLGAKVTISSATANPVRHITYQAAGTKHTIQ